MDLTETIFAIATPPGKSAISVIRISGPLAANVPKLFGAVCPGAGQFHMARLFADCQVIDEVIILFMEGPRSSTGEDVCELQCHGSNAVVNTIMEKLNKTVGFRPADAGEFTRRAFFNNKFDLLGVEGLADVIHAETPRQLYQAWSQIDGGLRGPVSRWREDLIKLASRLEVLIDFVDEDLPDNVETELREQTSRLISDIADILNDQRKENLSEMELL